MVLLWAILFGVIAIVLAVVAFAGVAVSMSFFTKILFFISFVCFCFSLILMIIEKMKAKH